MEAVNSKKLIRYRLWDKYVSLVEATYRLYAKNEDVQRRMINGEWYIKED